MAADDAPAAVLAHPHVGQQHALVDRLAEVAHLPLRIDRGDDDIVERDAIGDAHLERGDVHPPQRRDPLLEVDRDRSGRADPDQLVAAGGSAAAARPHPWPAAHRATRPRASSTSTQGASATTDQSSENSAQQRIAELAPDRAGDRAARRLHHLVGHARLGRLARGARRLALGGDAALRAPSSRSCWLARRSSASLARAASLAASGVEPRLLGGGLLRASVSARVAAAAAAASSPLALSISSALSRSSSDVIFGADRVGRDHHAALLRRSAARRASAAA